METLVEDWKQLSSEELMAKKDAIEAEMVACNTVLEKVRRGWRMGSLGLLCSTV